MNSALKKHRYNRLFQKEIQKGGGSALNYIKTFKNDKALEISVGNVYSGHQLINTLLENLQ